MGFGRACKGLKVEVRWWGFRDDTRMPSASSRDAPLSTCTPTPFAVWSRQRDRKVRVIACHYRMSPLQSFLSSRRMTQHLVSRPPTLPKLSSHSTATPLASSARMPASAGAHSSSVCVTS